MKKVLSIIVIAVVVLMSCETSKEHIKHQCMEPDTIPVCGHPHLSIKVGKVSGQAVGDVYQLLHLPDCPVCKEIRVQEFDSIIEAKGGQQ